MRIYLFLFVLIYCAVVQAKPLIAFERYGFIWTANIDGTNAKKITQGYIPEISPDGKYIAFNLVEKSPSGNRYLAIIELESGKITQLKNIPSENNFNPVWSPDSKKLLFNTFINSNWHLALIDRNDSGYRLINNTENEYSPAWAADGKSFFSHDLDSIYWLDLQGNVIKKWQINSIIPRGSMSSASRMNSSPNGKMLIMDVDMDETIHRKNWDEPPLALWVLHLDSGKTNRITPKGMLAWSPFWIDSDTYVFLGQEINEKTPSLHRGSLKNPSEGLLLHNVQTPSVSRQAALEQQEKSGLRIEKSGPPLFEDRKTAG
ncbi:translocation protein TolB [Fluoribacter dumoffii]|uniref:TolB family protein n=1 Tax=Fluoribacter dumoffii TaxID=463 RepID=UPI0022438004|nr:translocation protein TolB [Fluoribacter dumoffii]MCW8416806.1 translocation protein TolB [Fluoribacter dumoffii]MCW8455354.1 translocation protein TolB [Fluoribacter dumoffii]MCW8460568.1 translocation protein TolB [Fluoribacter dumoffii]MCW8484049.1 translocation protein TolB [Fluoribacter dumoffii]